LPALPCDTTVHAGPHTAIFGILVNSRSAERTSYPGNGLRVGSSSRIHHPRNPELLGAIGTPGDKLIGHEAFSFPDFR
jgi:hypothetical protein